MTPFHLPSWIALVVCCVAAGGGLPPASSSDPLTHQPDVGPPPGARQTPQTLRVGHGRPGAYVVFDVPLEEYVGRVLAAEAAARSAPATLEALAIVVRTFAVTNIGRHRADGFELCDSTHCQVMGTATPATRAAAEATAGLVLLYEGQPAPVFHTACCGGQSELPEDVWPRAQRLPFLERHKDAQCRGQSSWTSEVPSDDLLRALRGAGFVGELRGVGVAKRSASGRAMVVRLKGLEPHEIAGDTLRAVVGRALGWQVLKSTAFDVKRTRTGYRFAGRGSGHGVGLCLAGATRMGTEGKSAGHILAEYFPGTRIGPLEDAGPASGAIAGYQQMPR